jgi:glutathione S-transferase
MGMGAFYPGGARVARSVAPRAPATPEETPVKLYDSALAPNPRRVRIFLAEKGITVPTVQVDIAKAENRQPPYLAKNPLGGVPILELDDGTVIAESVAICRYFEETQPEPALMGTGAKDRAWVEMWQRRMELELALPIMQNFRNTHAFFKGRIPQVAEYGEVCRKSAESRLGWLDGQLADRAFIAGDRYTIADITALVGIDFGRVTNIRIAPDQKNLQRWYDAVSTRPSAKA